MRKLVITLCGLGLFVGLVWWQRVAIYDFMVEAQKAATVPEAVTYEEVAKEAEDSTDATETEDGLSVILSPVEPDEGSSQTNLEDSRPTGLSSGRASPEAAQDDTIIEEPEPDLEPEVSYLPLAFNLAVPFTSQAPNGDWSEPYQEACEEASLYMVHRYFEGDPAGVIDPGVADTGIWEVVNFENALLGFYKDTTTVQTAIVAEQMYGYERVEVLEDPTVEEIKSHVAAGRPVIVPAAGRQLGNPFFTSPGPLYHMLVIKGYTESTFITNDPGTRRGENYSYDVDALMSAIHDWNDGDVENGAKVAIVIYPNK